MDIDEFVVERLRPLLGERKRTETYFDLAGERKVRMGLNENLLVNRFFSDTLLFEAVKRLDVREYPPPKGWTAVRAIAEEMGVWEDEVLVGNGSDEILDLVAKVFLSSDGCEALIVDPTFEMYRFYALLAGGRARQVLTSRDFRLNADSVLSEIGEDTKVIFICSPNNPTGRQFDRDEVLRVVEESGRIVVLDEAYVDFAPYSLSGECTKYENLLVLRTFSKAFGIAALRAGYCLGNSRIIEWLRAAQSPFSVNSAAQQMVRLVLENRKVYDSFVKQVIEERNYLTAELEMVPGVEAYESDANFILFRLPDSAPSKEVVRRLSESGLEVRDRGSLPLLENCVRVTVSTRENNLKFIERLKEVMGELA
ncbi:MAG: histidinol-phosphate transaminase [Candidatus Verstraetearchaeota archaeon]|nr:histidinol-phosphate transaminase [Candidatus Verstraetearchaeota archaeon]